MSTPEDEKDPKGTKTGETEDGAPKKRKSMPPLTPEDVEMIGGRAISTQPEPPTSPPPPPPVTSPITVTANPPPPPPVTSPITVTANPPPPPPVTSPITVTASPPPPPPPQDPYDPNFDCNAATADEKAAHNQAAALAVSADLVAQAGFGDPGGTTGYNNKEYGSFTYRTSSGEIVASQPIEGSGTSINTITYGQSTPGGPYDLVVTPSEQIPISDIVGFTHNHPTSQSQGNQAEYPLPSTVNQRNTPTGTIATGDYAFAQSLINLGADPNLQLGIFAETAAGAGYQLRVYPYTATPPYDPNNPATWAPAYGPVVPLNLTPCP